MNASQAAEAALIDEILRWSLTVMAVVIVGWIAQYSLYQPWWKDPIGRMLVLLEFFLLVMMAPLVASLWFPHLSASVALDLAWVLVGGSILVTLALIGRVVVWYREHRSFRRPAGDSTSPGS